MFEKFGANVLKAAMEVNCCLMYYYQITTLGKVCFLLGRRGWVRALEGRVLSNFFTNWVESNLFYC